MVAVAVILGFVAAVALVPVAFVRQLRSVSWAPTPESYARY